MREESIQTKLIGTVNGYNIYCDPYSLMPNCVMYGRRVNTRFFIGASDDLNFYKKKLNKFINKRFLFCEENI